eukprot:879438-Lingulodinium_polyedra.AAC.1
MIAVAGSGAVVLVVGVFVVIALVTHASRCAAVLVMRCPSCARSCLLAAPTARLEPLSSPPRGRRGASTRRAPR